jgi:hypothetical protein
VLVLPKDTGLELEIGRIRTIGHIIQAVLVERQNQLQEVMLFLMQILGGIAL